MNLSPSSTEWVKFGKMDIVCVIGKEYICTGSGYHLLFTNITTKQEFIYHAKGGDSGEGVGYFIGHRNYAIFAFAERCPSPKIFIKSCPDFNNIVVLENGFEEKYISMSFSEDLLITLNSVPSNTATVWNWRNGAQLCLVPTGMFGKGQVIRCCIPNPVSLAQFQIRTNNLIVWEVPRCGKRCICVRQNVIGVPDAGVYTDLLWTTEGTLFVLDELGSVYAMGLGYILTRVIEWEDKGDAPTCFAWFKAGILVNGPNGIVKHFKKTGAWVCDWYITPMLTITKLLPNFKDILCAITNDYEILIYNSNENNFNYFKKCESSFNDMCLIYPTGEYFVTLQYNRDVVCWKVSTGEMITSTTLKGKVLAIKENPEYPYVGIVYDHGVLELLSLYKTDCITSMASFNLSRKPLNSIYFSEIGKLMVAANLNTGDFFIIEGIPGTKMKIIATLEAQCQICDYMLVASKTCMRLFTIHVTSEMYLAGDKIVRYCLSPNNSNIEVKTYELETNCQMYRKIYSTKNDDRDRVFLAVPLLTKCIHEITTRRGDPLAKVTKLLTTNHRMRKISLHVDKHHAVTYAYDGLVCVRNLSFDKILCAVMPHYRLDGGVLKAYVDPYTKHVISLGQDNMLTCTSITDIDISIKKKNELEELHNSAKFVLLFKRPTIGFIPTGKLEGKTWHEVQKAKQEESERALCETERKNILMEFYNIQAEIKELLTENLEGPENERLDMQEFNIDLALKEQKIQQSNETCNHTKKYLQEIIVAQDKVSVWLKKYCWDPIKVHGQSICGLYTNSSVQNFKLLKIDVSYNLVFMEQFRTIEKQMAQDDSFQPWEPKTTSELEAHLDKAPQMYKDHVGQTIFSILEDEDQQGHDMAPDFDTLTAFTGSSTNSFVELNPGHYELIAVNTFLQQEFEIAFCQNDMGKLRLMFNKRFNDMVAQKLREISLIKEKNARLRYIISELNYFSTDKIDITVDNPAFIQEEFPELVLQVDPKEVGITPYVSKSQQAILDAIAAEEERIRLLLLADDFRERALIVMMNGVLEIRWEDELKKDVPQPKCMLEKLPQDYNEDDIRIVREYDEAVKFLHSERERYKKILECEYARVANSVREIIRKFNNKLSELFLMQLQVTAALRQDIFKINRICLYNQRRTRFWEKEMQILECIQKNNKEMEELQKVIISLQEVIQDMKSNLEIFQSKDKVLEKAFKKDFADASPVVQEQTFKLYRRRPRASLRNVVSKTLTLEVAKCLMSHTQSCILTHDCLEYLKSVDVLDHYVNVPPAVDEPSYGLVCKHRRLKIENELKVKALVMGMSEGESSLSTFNKWFIQKKENGQKLQSDLERLRYEKLTFIHNIQLQLVVKQGIVELPTSGSISDFKDAVLVKRTDVELINKIIRRGGNKKIAAMKSNMDFRRDIVQMEWEHKVLKMTINDLEDFVSDIDDTKVTKTMRVYLDHKNTGEIDTNLSFEEEIELLKATYARDVENYKTRTNELQVKIDSIKFENKRLDKQINAVNTHVCEYQQNRDLELEKQEQDVEKIRMATLMKRARLVTQIQKNHNEILMLQTELELWRLKTYPTLSYKVLK